jgi:hypothetical protein
LLGEPKRSRLYHNATTISASASMASKKHQLFDADDEDDVNTLQINNDYAKSYSTWRAKEEKQKCMLFFMFYQRILC